MTGTLPDFIMDARFIDEEADVDRSKWPRDPSIYEPSDKFVQRFKELGGIIDEDDVTGAFRYGGLYKAKHDCVCFVNNLGGVAIYTVVSADHLELDSIDVERSHYRIVTLWAHVFDRDEAWATGRWTGQQLDTIDTMEPEETWDRQL